LWCLIAGEKVVSVDASLKCAYCENSIEAWFLAVSDDSVFSVAPRVRLERVTEQRRGKVTRVRSGDGEFDDLLENAQLAYEHGLGAGAVIYLRKAMEIVTTRKAIEVGITISKANGARKPFKDILTEVDRDHNIIPREFSDNGYQLFKELSGVIHGESGETDALQKYPPCKRLVLGIIDNVRSSRELRHASESMGWNQGQTSGSAPVGAIA
jgi:hypothetical protein